VIGELSQAAEANKPTASQVAALGAKQPLSGGTLSVDIRSVSAQGFKLAYYRLAGHYHPV
jgi:hypothetical protein